MKMTKKIFWLFVIVMLSLFASVEVFSAANTVDSNSASFTSVGKNSIEFTCNETGVYSLELIDGETGTFCINWTVSRVNGNYLRIACYKTQNPDTGEEYYQLCSPKGSTGDTTVKVVLQKGVTYRVSIGDAGGTADKPNSLNVVYNSSASSRDYKMSDVSSTSRTIVGNDDGDNAALESNAGFEVPDGAKIKLTDVNTIKSTDNPFEQELVRLLLAIGDYFIKILNGIIGQEVTITNLIFNQVDSVNINFFAGTAHKGLSSATIREVVNKWFSYFRKIAILLYLVCVLALGIRLIINSTAQGIDQARTLFGEWLKGILFLLLMPYLMHFLININEALVKKMEEAAGNKGYTASASFTDGSIWSATGVEFRSPEYISRYTGLMGYGTDEANTYYLTKVNDYASDFDLMKIARAYAGATYRLSYVFIWYILIGQLLTFIYIYYKRYFMIAFFIAIFPIICIFQAIGIMKDGRASAVSGWLGEFISNVFTQFIHCIIFVIVTGLVTELLRQGVAEGKLINWIVIIVAVNFVPQGEKILRRILKAISSGSSAEGLGDGGLRTGFRTLRNGARALMPHGGGPKS